MTRWYLELSTYRFISAGAHHYSARLIREDESEAVPVEWRLDASTARIWNKAEREGDVPYVWKVGALASRFESEAQAVKHAIDQWRRSARPGDVLVKGQKVYDDRTPVIARIPRRVTVPL